MEALRCTRADKEAAMQQIDLVHHLQRPETRAQTELQTEQCSLTTLESCVPTRAACSTQACSLYLLRLPVTAREHVSE